MSDSDVVEAFLSQEPAQGAPVATDGARLCINADVIAEWCEGGIIVTPVKQGQLHECTKDRLIHKVLLRMAGQQSTHAPRPMLVGVAAS
jgi:hypothetical protein